MIFSDTDPRIIYGVVWIAVMSALAVVLTVYDKYASGYRRRHRVPEAVLFLSAILGGSVLMYLTMLMIRHKTRHMSFMLGIPAVILVQYSAIWYLVNHL